MALRAKRALGRAVGEVGHSVTRITLAGDCLIEFSRLLWKVAKGHCKHSTSSALSSLCWFSMTMEPSGLCEKQDIILNVKLLKLLNSANTTFTYLILLGKQYAVPNLAIWKYIHHLTMQAIFNLILLPYIFISVCNQQYLPTNCKYTLLANMATVFSSYLGFLEFPSPFLFNWLTGFPRSMHKAWGQITVVHWSALH